MAEHTKGPWRVEPKHGRKDARGYWLHNDNGEYIALACRQEREDEELPNACLIAAAPDLLEALQKLVASGLLETLVVMDRAMIDDGDDPIAAPHVERILAALAKAKSTPDALEAKGGERG